MHRTSFVVAALALTAGLSACASPAAPVDPNAKVIVVSKPSRDSALPAPTVTGVVRKITADDAGKTIAVAIGSTFQIELVGVPTAGYLWAPKTVPAFLEKTAETGGATTTAQRKPGFTGGNHWEVFAYKANAAGSGEILLEQRRPWETDEPPVATFKVTIEAR